jgi:hypothetical protein
VAAEIVVIVQDQNAGSGALHPIEIRSRQSAQSGAHDHEIVDVGIRLFDAAPILPAMPYEVMSNFEGAGVVST